MTTETVHGEEVLRSVLADASARLRAVGVASAAHDARLLLAHAAELSANDLELLLIQGATVARLATGAVERFSAVIDRRAAREPLQHITGVAHFRYLDLRVGPGVFVPRPETEMLVQIAIDHLVAAGRDRSSALDIGTGSAAVALALATEVPGVRVTAVEQSPDAARWAERNIAAHGAGRVELVLGDVHDLFGSLPRPVDVIASNPPYIPADAVPRDPEVHRFDPAGALYSGADGLDLIRVLGDRCRELIADGGLLAIEHGEQQGPAVRAILADNGWRDPRTRRDYTGRDRVTAARWERRG